MAVTGRDQRALQCWAETESAKGLDMLEGAVSEKKSQNCSGDLNPNMRPQTDTGNGLVDLWFKLLSF